MGKRLLDASGRKSRGGWDATAENIVELEARIKSAHSGRKVADTMKFADKVLEGYGVEAVRGDHYDRYFQDTMLYYVNQGGTYDYTLCYDVVKGKFFDGDWGSWVEHYGDKLEV